MPANITQEVVETVLRTTGAAAYTASMRTVAGAAGMVGGVIGNLVSQLNPLNALLGGLSFAVAAHEITALGSAYENTRRLIAGTFATMGAAGDFNQGLALASTTMDQIAIAAARLPGEAEDYISTFQAGLPVLLQTMHGPMTEITDFSNRFTAIMSTLGVSSMEAGMMISRALASGHGALDQQSMAARRLMPFIEAATAGTAHQVHSITQFNALTAEQRQQVLALTMQQEGLNHMLEDAGSSWDAQTGALTSALSMMTRMATTPVFDGMKDGLAQVNALLMDSEGHWTTLAQTIINAGQLVSTHLVGAVTQFAQGVESAGAVIAALASGGGMIAGAGPSQVEGGFRQSATGDPASDALAHVGGIIQTLSSVIDPVAGLFERLNGVLEPMNMVGQALLGALDTLLAPIGLAVQGITYVAGIIFDALAPGLDSLWNGVSSLVTGIADFLNPILRILVIGLIAVVDAVSTYLMPVINAWIDMIGTAIDALGQFLSWLGQVIGDAMGVDEAEANMRSHMDEGGIHGVLQGLLARLDGTAAPDASAAEAAARREGPAAPGGPRGGAHTTQDFRYSRFDITQRFEEGFDPDRVAVAFADDLGRAGERRTQSSFAPLFSVR